MKNLFCRICRGRFNLKYPPAAAVGSENNPILPAIVVQIAEGGEISGNICWDCEDTLLGFHKSVGEDNDDEEEPVVVVDDDEILYKNLEKTIRIHRLSKEVEIIEIESSESDDEDCFIIPKEDNIIRIESIVVRKKESKKNRGDALVAVVKKNTSDKIPVDQNLKKDMYTRAKIFESMRCPLCPYLSGIECEVVFHIRQNHPHYTGEHLRFDPQEGDTSLTRRIIFARMLTFFECKACGKIHDRFWAHRKHLTVHDRKNPKTKIDNDIALNNNEVLISHINVNKVQTSKRALDTVEQNHEAKNPKLDDRVLRRATKDKNSTETNQATTVDISKSLENAAKKQQNHSANKKSKAKGLLRKKQKMQARREKRRQKREEEKRAKTKSRSTPVIPKPTFKMPQQPAPRASSVVKQLLSQPRYTCKLCSTTLATFIAWNVHMISTHSDIEFNYKSSGDQTPDNICRKCDKRFQSASNLRIHTRLSHRRKNRLVEINGNDNEEICRQTLTPKKVSKEQEQQKSDDSPLPNGVAPALENPNPTSTSALICPYCGILFGDLLTMSKHEPDHIASDHAKRIFQIKPQA